MAIPGAVIVREKNEKKSNTRDEIDERLETEQVHHLGHLTNQVNFICGIHLSPRPLSAIILESVRVY